MVNLQKIDDSSVKFVFEDSDHYLFGDGEIVVPVNSLSLVIDDSEMVTFKKSATGDPFISFRPDNSNLGTKEAIETFYKENMVGGSGGVSEEEVQEMIDAAMDGVWTDIDEKEEVIASALTEVRQDVADKQDALSAGTGIEISGNVISATGGGVTVDPTLDSGSTNPVANSAITQAINDAKAYYISFATIATTGIRDEDWDGIVAAIDDHRPIYAGYPRNDGGILYYGVECMNKNSDNTQIILTSSDDSVHYFYTFTKNGSNDYSYTVSTKPYVPTISTAVTSGSTDSEIPTAKAVYDATQGGGGKAIVAGRGIEVTTGATADTVSFSLPISAGTGENSIVGLDSNTVNSKISFAFGSGNILSNTGSSYNFAIGRNNSAQSDENILLGRENSLASSNGDNVLIGKGNRSTTFYNNYNYFLGETNTLSGVRNEHNVILGFNNKISDNYVNYVSILGYYLQPKNKYEIALGKYNSSNTGSTDADKTLLSVGNGTDSARHNAFEIRQNGDIYIALNGQDVKLQDQLGGGGGSSYTAGDGIDITNDVISVTGKVETSAITSAITSASTNAEVAGAKAVYDAIQAGGGSSYSAGTNISIANDTINCTLPITASTSNRSQDIAIGNDIIGVGTYGRIIIGDGNKNNYNNSRTDNSILIGTPSNSSTIYNVVKASNCIGIGGNGLEVGYDNFSGYGSIAIGYGSKSIINKSLAIGYNTVASGTTQTNINNQIKVDTNNQVYIKDKDNVNEVCIQDAIAALGGLKFVKLSQSEYDQLATKDANTLYIISNVVS